MPCLQRQNLQVSFLGFLRLMASDPKLTATFKKTSMGRFLVGSIEKWAPGWVSRLRRWKGTAQALGPVSSAAAAQIPPLWLADLFGLTTTTLSSVQAQRILGWSPRIDLKKGQPLTVAWLKETVSE